MYPKVVVCSCNKNFAEHLLSYPPATNGAKRNLGKLRYSCQRAPDAREVSVSFLVGYPKWKVRCRAAASSLSKDTKVCLP